MALPSSVSTDQVDGVRAPGALAEGYQLTVQYTEDPEQMWVELRFIGNPTGRVRRLAEEHLNRMNCGRIVELAGECKGHMPEYIDLLMADALAESERRETSVRDKMENIQA